VYLALEDSERGLTKYFGGQWECWPARLALATSWRRLDQGGLEDLRKWCASEKEPALVEIDSFKRVRPPSHKAQTDYDADYEACQGLMDLTHEWVSGNQRLRQPRSKLPGSGNNTRLRPRTH
jgi:hypothetical protein